MLRIALVILIISACSKKSEAPPAGAHVDIWLSAAKAIGDDVELAMSFGDSQNKYVVTIGTVRLQIIQDSTVLCDASTREVVKDTSDPDFPRYRAKLRLACSAKPYAGKRPILRVTVPYEGRELTTSSDLGELDKLVGDLTRDKPALGAPPADAAVADANAGPVVVDDIASLAPLYKLVAAVPRGSTQECPTDDLPPPSDGLPAQVDFDVLGVLAGRPTSADLRALPWLSSPIFSVLAKQKDPTLAVDAVDEATARKLAPERLLVVIRAVTRKAPRNAQAREHGGYEFIPGRLDGDVVIVDRGPPRVLCAFPISIESEAFHTQNINSPQSVVDDEFGRIWTRTIYKLLREHLPTITPKFSLLEDK